MHPFETDGNDFWFMHNLSNIRADHKLYELHYVKEEDMDALRKRKNIPAPD